MSVAELAGGRGSTARVPGIAGDAAAAVTAVTAARCRRETVSEPLAWTHV